MIKWQGCSSSHDIYRMIQKKTFKNLLLSNWSPWSWKSYNFQVSKYGVGEEKKKKEKKKKGNSTIWCILDVHIILSY